MAKKKLTLQIDKTTVRPMSGQRLPQTGFINREIAGDVVAVSRMTVALAIAPLPLDAAANAANPAVPIESAPLM